MRQSTRIVLIVPRFPQLSETFIVSKFLGLLDQGWDVHVVCSRRDRTAWPLFTQLRERPGISSRVHEGWPIAPRPFVAFLFPFMLLRLFLRRPVKTTRYLKLGWRWFGLGVLRRLYLDAAIVQLAPDIIHFEFGSSAVGRMRLREILQSRIVVSFRGHDLNFVGLEAPNYYTTVWQDAAGIHCLGTDLWHRAIARGCPPTMLHALIPPAIDADKFRVERMDEERPVGTRDRPLRLLSVARLYWTKGHEYALEAVSQLLDVGTVVEMRIVGGGNFEEAVTFCRHQLGLTESVILLGPRSPEYVRKQLAWADAFVHLSVSEGFCNAVMEAQAAGLPVVCSDADGLPANVQNGVTGFVVPRRSAHQAAARLEQLAGDPALRRRMGAAGRARVRHNFKLRDQILAFSGLYQQVLEEQ